MSGNNAHSSLHIGTFSSDGLIVTCVIFPERIQSVDVSFPHLISGIGTVFDR